MGIIPSIMLILLGIIFFLISASSDFEFGAIISAIWIVAFAWNIYNIKTSTKSVQTKNVEYKYPSKYYVLDYEIIKRGDQVDTVYVITKKNFE